MFRSSKHIYAQVIDDVAGKTLAHCFDARPRTSKGALDEDNKVEAAKKVGRSIARICKAKRSTKVVFDRNGYLYHGRVERLAEGGARGGLEF